LEIDDLIIAMPKDGSDPLSTLPEPCPGFSLDKYLARVRKQLFLFALSKANGNQSEAADLLGVTKQAVNKFLKGDGANAG
jgi:DNA-binding NtrC family response regulator